MANETQRLGELSALYYQIVTGYDTSQADADILAEAAWGTEFCIVDLTDEAERDQTELVDRCTGQNKEFL